MDGVFEIINPGGRFVYEFYAEQFGVYPYHCHVMPLEEHISHRPGVAGIAAGMLIMYLTSLLI